MGLEYPVLAIMASVAFLVVILSSLFLYLYVISELREVPVLSGSVEVYSIVCNSTRCTRLILTVSNERGSPAELVQIRVYADNGALTINFSATVVVSDNGNAVQNVVVHGLVDGKILLPGAAAHIVIDVSRACFTAGKTYQAIVFFDKGSLILSFDIK